MTDDNICGEMIALGIGSNLGDSRAIILGAIKSLTERINRIRISSFYRSEPMYVVDQPFFINAVVVGCYSGDANELLAFVQSIEYRFGRTRTRPKGERTLDIDILLFGKKIIDNPPTLTVPHPEMRERRFVLVPLLELEPELLDPLTGKSYQKLLCALPVQGIYYHGSASYNPSQ